MLPVTLLPAAPGLAASDPASPAGAGLIATNDAAFSGVPAGATGIPREALEDQDTITIFRFWGPGAAYPGARPIMASPGPSN